MSKTVKGRSQNYLILFSYNCCKQIHSEGNYLTQMKLAVGVLNFPWKMKPSVLSSIAWMFSQNSNLM